MLLSHIFMHFQTFLLSSDYVEQICHVLVTTPTQAYWKEIWKYWKHTIFLKKLCGFISYFVALWAVITILWTGNIPVWMICTNTPSPKIHSLLISVIVKNSCNSKFRYLDSDPKHHFFKSDHVLFASLAKIPENVVKSLVCKFSCYYVNRQIHMVVCKTSWWWEMWIDLQKKIIS